MESLPLRHILVSVDESKAATKAFEWAIDNLYRDGDMVHLFHVIAPGQYAVLSSDLGVDEIIENNEETSRRTEHANRFLTSQFVPKLADKKIPYQIEIVKFATDCASVGSIICKRADQLCASAVVLAKHNKGKVQEFFVGSVTNHCTQHCRSPVLVMHTD